MTPAPGALDQMDDYGAAFDRGEAALPPRRHALASSMPSCPAPSRRGLNDDELSAFFSLLFSAGSETTRNAIAGAMLAFVDWPDQLEHCALGSSA